MENKYYEKELVKVMKSINTTLRGMQGNTKHPKYAFALIDLIDAMLRYNFSVNTIEGVLGVLNTEYWESSRNHRDMVLEVKKMRAKNRSGHSAK
jgi:hypothetical protein